MSIISILIIAYIVYIVYKNKQQNEQNTKTMNNITKNYNNQTNNNSYYSKQKINSYKKMNEDHINHEDIKDITESIGYKRCPNCNSTISKKSSSCFMCNYEFIKEEKKDN